MVLVDQKLCSVALDACDTSAFEQFAQSFHASIVGTSFVPLGGMHDGGADGFEEKVFYSDRRPTSFMQASKTADIEGKIVATIKRIRAFGRDLRSITFYFSESISQSDRIEEEISDREDITIRIRGKQYIEAHINDSPQSAQAFESYLKPAIFHLLEIGGSGKGRDFPYEAKTLCAFLGQEINRRRGNESVLLSITDALILWSLEGTDPDKGIYLTVEEIRNKIEVAIPAARTFIRGELSNRLELLRSKSNSNGREINWYRNTDSYALRYEQRQKLIDENVEEVALFSEVNDSFRSRLRNFLPEKLHNRIPDIADVIRSCIEAMFYKQGVSLGLYIVDQPDGEGDGINIAGEIDQYIDTLGLDAKDRTVVVDSVRSILRGIIYSPTSKQREYMLRLSNTYFILFALKNDAKVVEYFNSLSEKLIVYVGSDLIIKALSEYHLAPESQMITNSLAVIRQSGAHLILAEPAFEEVFTHIHASILEFENFYREIEPSIDEDFVPVIDRILIRSYFYARLNINVGQSAKKISGWRSYIGQFCNYEEIRRKKGQESLRMYLCDRFGLQFEYKEGMIKTIDRDELSKLTFAIVKEREGSYLRKKYRATVLAYNDALHVLRIYSKRKEIDDNSAPNQFGFRTWWLTHEKAVQRAAMANLGQGKPRVIMRPEFLLNYIALMPSKKEVAESYKSIFPTVLGVSLSKRAPAGLLHQVLTSAREAFSVDNSRAKAKLNELSDRLKSDQLRIYETEFNIR